MMSRLVVLLLGCCLATIGSMAAPTIESQEQIWEFMNRFGYIKKEDMVNGLPKDEETERQSIIYFQKMGNLTMTGTLDENSMTLMNTPRCGLKDSDSLGGMLRKKRFALGPRWRNTDLTWRIENRTPDLDQADVDRIMKEALNVWSNVSSLTFREVTTLDADILISFARGEHGDRYSFDGEGRVLAHAYFPSSDPLGGDAHFDEDETYTDGINQGINLFQVAAHEFGHSLGLRHSDVGDALMYAYYRGYVPNFQLHSDDIAGIQALYGEGNAVPEESGTPSTPVDNCMRHISWATRTADGSAYFGNETHVFRRTVGYPKRIGDEFPGLPTGLDAAIYVRGITYFFKGSEYWGFRNRQPRSFFPVQIPRGLPDNLDSAFIWSGDNRIYFTKGNQYYFYKSTSGSYVPSPLSDWEGLPSDGVDAAFQYRGFTYFFKGSEYYRYNDITGRVDDADPPYPRSTAIQWLGCDPNELVLGGDATVLVPSMVAVLVSALSALYHAF